MKYSNKSRLIAMAILLLAIVLLLWPRSTQGNSLELIQQELPYPLKLEETSLLPSDMCYHEGIPVIYSNEYQPHGYYSFSYMNTNGYIVSLRYADTDVFNPGYNLISRKQLNGGRCVP